MLILVRSLFCPDVAPAAPPIDGLWLGSAALAKIYATAASLGSLMVVATIVAPGRTLRLELGRSLTDELPNVLDRTMGAGSSTEAERSRVYK